jgi:MFS family permease
MPLTNNSIFRGNFVLVFLASLLVFTAFYIMLPTLPVFLTRELKIEEGQTGLILAVYTLAALLIRPFTGFLIDRYGRKLFYIPSLLLFAVIFVGYPLAGAFALIMIVRFAHGLVWGVATTTGSTLIVDIVPAARRGEGIGLYGLAMTIPMAMGPFTGLQLTQNNNYTLMFLCAGALAFAGFLLTLFIKYPAVPRPANSSFSFRNLLESTSLPVTFNLLFINIGYGGLVSFVSLYALKTGIGNTGIFFIVFASGITLARIYMGKIFDRHGPKALSVSGILLLAAGHILLGLIINTTGFMVAAFLLGLGSGVVFPTFQAMVNNLVPPHRRGAANSTLFSGLDLGIGLGMLITGFLAHAIGLPHTYLIYGGLNLIALLYFLFISLAHYQKILLRGVRQDNYAEN